MAQASNLKWQMWGAAKQKSATLQCTHSGVSFTSTKASSRSFPTNTLECLSESYSNEAIAQVYKDIFCLQKQKPSDIALPYQATYACISRDEGFEIWQKASKDLT